MSGPASHELASTVACFSSKLTSTFLTPATFMSASCTRRVQEPFQVIPSTASVTAQSPAAGGEAARPAADAEVGPDPGRGW